MLSAAGRLDIRPELKSVRPPNDGNVVGEIADRINRRKSSCEQTRRINAGKGNRVVGRVAEAGERGAGQTVSKIVKDIFGNRPTVTGNETERMTPHGWRGRVGKLRRGRFRVVNIICPKKQLLFG